MKGATMLAILQRFGVVPLPVGITFFHFCKKDRLEKTQCLTKQAFFHTLYENASWH